ncbi:hypothetical protein ACH79_18045 [Bradyrhizobium sp. CCBAU 051011]|uniref:DUF1236 domain-containing protein n=1 Tax=Bradyrhizobium sp. CCBAU 051011 TaxID=858422 RepID=UPI0013738C1F|nr:DUF1236 domain-containing protein [Bradyrhizobium sp. CCBAU 051011]QHO74250.1 hypothetical protein ACH79_18045 [Bradyrhizobium sp. CCBAU 051011]
MRKQLLLSTGIICLMLAPAVSYGQAPGARGEEQKQMRPSDSGKGAASQERGAERAQERGQAAEQKAQGGREERGTGSRQTEERGKAAPSSERPATAADDSRRGRGDDAKSGERAQDSRSRDAQTAREKDAKDGSKDSKGSAEMKRDSDREKSRAESDKAKEGSTAAQKERESTTTAQKEPGRDQRDGAKNAAEQGKDASRPSTATDTTRTQPSTSAQTGQSQTGQAQTSQQSNVSVDKQVRISETLTRERLAAPQRNLNVSIRVGERIPQRVRVHRLPDTIVAIEPQYRGYDYFTTEEEIVIVEPRTHRIVSQIPRDASRIRAAGGASGTGSTSGTAGTGSSGSYTGTMAAAGGASPCRIMRRDTAGNVTELTPQTVGSAAAQQETISVTVRVPGGASTAPIALGAADGQIVVSGQTGADCMVTIEPQTR